MLNQKEFLNIGYLSSNILFEDALKVCSKKISKVIKKNKGNSNDRSVI